MSDETAGCRKFPSVRGPRGFTLLELLVAITLLSMIALIMAGGLRLSVRAWDRSVATADNVEAVEAAQRFLRHKLAAVYPAWQTDGAVGYVLFDGQPHSLAFIAPPPAALGPAGYQRFELALGSDGALMLGWRPRGQAAGAMTVQAPLLTGVESLDLAYFGADRSGHDERWRDTWTAQPTLPRLVRIRLRFSARDPRVWPDLVVQPEITVDVACVYDAAYRNCRGR